MTREGRADEEKVPAPLTTTAPVLSYPEVPPPPYAAATTSNPVPQHVLVAGTVVNPPFVAIPATRYDTMTSYVEDGSGVQTIITAAAVLDRPIMVRCPFCKTTVTTEIKSVTGCLTWLCCVALSAVGCVYGCCLIPFCTKRLRDVEHNCPKCHNLIALYKRI